MVKCSKCGYNNEEGHEFCEECGSKLKLELKCYKCGHSFKRDDEFCEECGAKIKEFKSVHHEHREERKLGKHKWWLITSAIVLILATIFVFAIPLPYTAKEGYNEKVPYKAQESYTEKEPQSKSVCKNVDFQHSVFEMPENDFNGGLCTSELAQIGYGDKCAYMSNFRVRNLEPKSGVFELQCVFTDGGFFRDVTRGIQAQQEATFQCRYAYDIGKTVYLKRYEVLPPSKEECSAATEYKDTTKYRTTTKYKDEYKERFVTKYGTLFQQWSGKVKYYEKV